MKTDCWFCRPCKRGMQNLCSPGAAHGPSKPTVTKPLAELGGKIAVPRQKWALLPQHATGFSTAPQNKCHLQVEVGSWDKAQNANLVCKRGSRHGQYCPAPDH
jgi:hypothetical protein